MFSFSSIRVFTRSVFALFVVLCLSTALFIGCKLGSDPYIDDHKLKTALIGTWEDKGEWGTDGYKITAKELQYLYEGDVSYSGTIEFVSNFSDDAGVIVIKYTSNAYNAATVGKYVGVYYQNLKPGVSVEMSTAYADGKEIKDSMYDAAVAFTMGNTGDYITVFGGPYLKQ